MDRGIKRNLEIMPTPAATEDSEADRLLEPEVEPMNGLPTARPSAGLRGIG